MPVPRLIAVHMVLALVIASLAIAGCGRRGDPEPPPGVPAAEAVPYPEPPAPDVQEEPPLLEQDDFLDPP